MSVAGGAVEQSRSLGLPARDRRGSRHRRGTVRTEGRSAAPSGDDRPRVRVGQRRPARHDPEQPTESVGSFRQPRPPAAAVCDPGEPGGASAAREDRVGALRRRRQDEAARLHRGRVPVVEVPLEHECLGLRDQPERPAVGVRAGGAGKRSGQATSWSSQGTGCCSVTRSVRSSGSLDADRPRPVAWYAAGAADDPELRPARAPSWRRRGERAQPGAPEVLRPDRPVVAPAQALAQVERPDEAALAARPTTRPGRARRLAPRSASGPRRARARRSARAGRPPCAGSSVLGRTGSASRSVGPPCGGLGADEPQPGQQQRRGADG